MNHDEQIARRLLGEDKDQQEAKKRHPKSKQAAKWLHVPPKSLPLQ